VEVNQKILQHTTSVSSFDKIYTKNKIISLSQFKSIVRNKVLRLGWSYLLHTPAKNGKVVLDTCYTVAKGELQYSSTHS